jgi:hypothetical protein
MWKLNSLPLIGQCTELLQEPKIVLPAVPYVSKLSCDSFRSVSGSMCISLILNFNLDWYLYSFRFLKAFIFCKVAVLGAKNFVSKYGLSV